MVEQLEPGGTEQPTRRYRSPEEDSDRWRGFEFRDGDIVISTRSKSGTTWLQMICALLVFERPDLPAPLWELSPWLDWLVRPRSDVFAFLAAQAHRRIIKTHTPLDGVPIDPRVTYIVAGRHPLDQAVSLHHQGANIDRARLAELVGPAERAGRDDEDDRASAERSSAQPDLVRWLRNWIASEAVPEDELDSLPGVMHHLGDAWSRRHRSNIVLVHYTDLVTDLGGEMERLARAVDSAVSIPDRADLVAAARFTSMRERAEDLAPDPVGVLKDRTAFFRGGRLGDGEAALGPGDHERYRNRVEALGSPGLIGWLHGGRSSIDPDDGTGH